MKPDPALPYLSSIPAPNDRRTRPRDRNGSRMEKRDERFWHNMMDWSNRRVRLKSGDSTALYFRGSSRIRFGQPLAALCDLDRSLAIDPSSMSSHFERGNALMDLERYTESIEAHTQAIERGASDYDDGLKAVAYNNRAVAKGRMGRTEAAIEDYGATLLLNPDYTDALNNRGNLLIELGRHEEALADFDRCIAKAPKDSLMHANRASALLRLHRPEEALIACELALTIDPKGSIALYNKACALAQRGRPEEARQWLERAIATDPGNVEDAHRDPHLKSLLAS